MSRHSTSLCSISTPRLVHIIGLLTAVQLNAAPLPVTVPSMVYTTESEFQTLADVNGDGDLDLVLVDKASGRFRIAEGNNSGDLSWRENIGESGLTQLGGFSTGRVLQANRDQLIFSAPLANRIQIVDSPNDTALTQPQRVPETSIGATLALAINLPGGSFGKPYDPDFLDLAYYPSLLSPSEPGKLETFRNAYGTLPFSEKGDGVGNISLPRQVNRIELETGELPAFGELSNVGNATHFRLLDAEQNLEAVLDVQSILPANAAYVYADFDGDTLSEFLFFVPGSDQLYPLKWSSGQLKAQPSFTYSASIADIRVINSTGTPELLIIHKDRLTADRVSYSGENNFSVQENFASTQASFTGAFNRSGQLHLLEGSNGTDYNQVYTYQGDGTHKRTDTISLPNLRNKAAGSSVLIFDAEPLIHSDAQLIGRYQAGPWTSGFSLGGNQLDVVVEQFDDSSQGLGDPQVKILAGLPAGAGGALTNQIADDNSIFFTSSAIGEITSELSISPPSGSYDNAVRPEFEVSANTSIVYRTTTRVPNWTSVSTQPPLILDDTTLYAVAIGADGTLSNVVRADYVITGDVNTRDSNGDGVPDFVAQQYGLDPLAATFDHDQDGFTDFQEILAGTSPTDGNDFPDRTSVAYAYPNAFDLFVSPAVPNPNDPETLLRPDTPKSGASSSTSVKTYQANGLFMGSAKTAEHEGVPHPAAKFNAIDAVVDDLFLVTISDANFTVDDEFTNNYGRQVAGLVKMPTMEFAPFEYDKFGAHGGYDALAAEVADWRIAALDYFENLERPMVSRDPVDPDATLELLLLENFLGKQLLARGLSDRNHISLTPFRPDEAPLDALPLDSSIDLMDIPSPLRDRAVSTEMLQALQRIPAGGGSAFKITDVIDAVRHSIATTKSSNVLQLKTLAQTLYTTSAQESDATTVLRQPLDALRHFIRNGNLDDTGYEETPMVSNFPPILLLAAQAGIVEIESAINPRTVDTVHLYIVGDELANDCPVWQEIYDLPDFDPDAPMFTGITYELVDDQGATYPITRAFPLTPGSVFAVSGYVLENANCGDVALEVIPQIELVSLRNASPLDQNANLIPDSIEARHPSASFDAFGDTDGDDYTDLQELITGSDPLDGASIPMNDDEPAAIEEVSPPQLKITTVDAYNALIEFEYPSDLVPYVDFELYSSSDLSGGFTPTNQKARHLGSDAHELLINTNYDSQRFYIFHMQLK